MDLPEGWYKATDDDKQRLTQELRTEMIPGHFLDGKVVAVVAHRDGATDDILCQHIDEADLFTVVHLSWSMKPEIDVHHPTIEFSGTFAAFVKWEENFR